MYKFILHRNIVPKSTAEVEGLATAFLKLISNGLGSGDDYFTWNLNKVPIRMNINPCPPYPHPSVTLGLPKHCDPNLVTILLQQKSVGGLQVQHVGQWAHVDPIPSAFVVNFGHVLEVTKSYFSLCN